ncbi:hypothetical protein [Mycobacterium sp. URHB0044]|jgi:hypothetical protein|uniref:hypothetical protein n=1 Tax=Mycobacterium sp. URHB0044 TaxID=1380386 RepID=UPI00048FE9AD|nr:hypothetical protein [Mycobacterium sp. URHB0044]
MTTTRATTLALLAAALLTAGCSATTSDAPVATPVALQPCDWVTADEAAAVLGGPVTTSPHDDQSDAGEMSCGYSRGIGDNGMTSELQLSGTFPVAPANATPIEGVGVKAHCVIEPTTTPPSTTLVVSLSGGRLYRVTGWYTPSCDSLKQLAKAAVGRIGP